MKKGISKFLIVTMLVSLITPAVSAATSVTMTVNTASVTHEVTKNLYGINNEWWDTEDTYLGKDYGKLGSFSQDFQNPEYHAVMPEYSSLYLNQTDGQERYYIKNGSTITNNASQSSIVFDGDLYENQFVDGVLQHPVDDILKLSDYKPSFSGYKNPTLYVGGLDGYVGFTSTYDFQFRYHNLGKKPTDMLVVYENGGNYALNMSPTQNGRTSYFGKENLSVMDKTSLMSFSVKLEDKNGVVRLSLVKDGDLSNVGNIWEELGYANTGVGQFILNKGASQWLDAVTINAGQVKLGKSTAVCSIDAGKWYTINYYLNTEVNPPEHMLVVLDSDNSEVARSKSVQVKTGEKTDIPNLSGTAEFSFSDDAEYSYVVSNTANSSTSAYIDNLEFSDIRDEYNTEDSVNMRYVKDLEGYPIPLTRMAGGSSQRFDWKAARGDVNERSDILYAETRDSSGNVTNSHYKPERMGIAEWVKTTEAIDKDAGYVYTINLDSGIDTNEDIIDLLEYLVGDRDLNGNGFDGALERGKDGLSGKVNVVMWELGNESDLDDHLKWDINKYLTECKRVLDIIERYEKSGDIAQIPISAHVSTYLSGYLDKYSWGIIKTDEYDYHVWMEKVISEIGTRIDYLSVHGYYNESSTNNNGQKVDFYTRVNRKLGYIENAIGNNNLKIAFTEHARGSSVIGDSGVGDRTGWNKLYNLEAAISEAEFYNRVMMHPSVEIACYHAQSDEGPWMLTYYDTDGTMKATLPYETIKLYAENGVGDVLSSTMTGFEKLAYSDYSGSAVKDENGDINLFFSNRSANEIAVTLKGLEGYTAVTKTTITGTNLTDFRGYNSPDDKTTIGTGGTITTEAHNSNTSITLPKYSVVMLKLKETASYEANEKINAVKAIFAGTSSATVSGTADADALVSVVVTNKTDGTITYVNDVTADAEGKYSFTFGFTDDLANYDIKVWRGESLDTMTSTIDTITAVNDLFEVTYDMSVSDSDARKAKAKVTIRNKYFTTMNCNIILAEYSASKELQNIKVSNDITLLNGENEKTVEMSIDNEYNRYKVFVWHNMNDLIPLSEAK